MNLPEVLPAGTLLRLGPKPGCIKSSYDMLVKTTEECKLIKGTTEYGHIYSSKVLENPNGWHHSTVSHSPDLKFDVIIYPNNKQAKVTLERFED